MIATNTIKAARPPAPKRPLILGVLNYFDINNYIQDRRDQVLEIKGPVAESIISRYPIERGELSLYVCRLGEEITEADVPAYMDGVLNQMFIGSLIPGRVPQPVYLSGLILTDEFTRIGPNCRIEVNEHDETSYNMLINTRLYDNVTVNGSSLTDTALSPFLNRTFDQQGRVVMTKEAINQDARLEVISSKLQYAFLTGNFKLWNMTLTQVWGDMRTGGFFAENASISQSMIEPEREVEPHTYSAGFPVAVLEKMNWLSDHIDADAASYLVNLPWAKMNDADLTNWAMALVFMTDEKSEPVQRDKLRFLVSIISKSQPLLEKIFRLTYLRNDNNLLKLMLERPVEFGLDTLQLFLKRENQK